MLQVLQPQDTQNPSGRGLGYGRGRGFRRISRSCFSGIWTLLEPRICCTFAEVYDEREILSRQAKILEQQLRQIEKRLAALRKMKQMKMMNEGIQVRQAE